MSDNKKLQVNLGDLKKLFTWCNVLFAVKPNTGLQKFREELADFKELGKKYNFLIWDTP